MPMFEYRCGACGHAFERYEAGRSAGQAEKVACTSCGKERAERTISTFSAGCGGGGSNVSIGTAGCGGGGGFS
jgi:putative FmdB family regulatory protein